MIPNSSSDSDRNTDNRISANFFGSPSVNQKKKSKDIDSNYTLNQESYWNQPPPPYASSDISTNPSAPPLELTDDSHTLNEPFPLHSSSDSLPYQQNVPQLPQASGSRYGTISPIHPSSTTSDHHWPWHVTPSFIGSPNSNPPQPLPTQPPSSPNQQNKKRINSFCDYLAKCLMLLLCISLVLRIIQAFFGAPGTPDNCSHGFVWEGLDKQINFGNGSFDLNIVGGRLSTGMITIKALDDFDRKQGILEGSFQSVFVASPKSFLDDPELSYSITRDDDTVNVQINIPHNRPSSCVDLHAIVYIPKKMQRLSINAPDSNIQVKYSDKIYIDQLILSTSNSGIEMMSDWEGEDLVLITSNAAIEVSRKLYAKQDIGIYTSYGMILFKDSAKALKHMELNNKNGVIRSENTLIANNLVISNTYGSITVNDAQVDYGSIKTLEGNIDINTCTINSSMNVQTNKGYVQMQVQDKIDAHVYVFTGQGNLALDMPIEFEGIFSLESHKIDNLQLIDPYRWTHVEKANYGKVSGNRYKTRGIGKKPDGNLNAIALNGDIQLVFV
ncbi:hypothetical protein BD560DRAFT_411871 [Blakeslea trispora]|nr:hypothetical protein BD560DRAFT_411871 [Blakeslea trispora]